MKSIQGEKKDTAWIQQSNIVTVCKQTEREALPIRWAHSIVRATNTLDLGTSFWVGLCRSEKHTTKRQECAKT